MLPRPTRIRADRQRGQALVELALILPVFTMLLAGIIVLGIGVFQQQQLANAAREGARYAAVHSATSQCPTSSSLDPRSGAAAAYVPLSYDPFCDPPPNWPNMTAHARNKLFALDEGSVVVTACWSGYRELVGTSPAGAYDAPPPGTYDMFSPPITYDTGWAQCTIDGVDPNESPAAIDCETGLARTDEASAMSEGPGVLLGNRVTVFVCYTWEPPMAGFLLIPSQVALRAVATEAIQRQQ